LNAPRWTNRNNHPPAFFELLEEWGREMVHSTSNDDAVKRGLFFPAKVPITPEDRNIPVPKPKKAFLRFVGQSLDDFHCVHLASHFAKDCRLVPGTSAYFKDSLTRLRPKVFSHEGHDVGLGDGLPVSDGKWGVFIG